MREDLDVDIGRLVPAVSFRLESILRPAGRIEEQHLAIGAVLPRAAERRVGRVVVPHVGFAVAARNRATVAPDAKALLRAALHAEVEIRELDLPDAQRR